jgi:FkbM family methyltransferase
MKNKLKKIARNYLPESLYFFIYRVQYKILNKKDLNKKEEKFARFTKKGLYDFALEDINFKIFLNPDNGGVDYEIFAEKNFEPGILKLIRKSLEEKKDCVFIDVGANIGQHSMYASHFAKKVYSFEPIKKIYNQFFESVFENDFLNISIWNYALGNKKEILPIYSNEINVGASSLLVSDGGRKLLQNIKVEKLDDIYEKMGIEKTDFMKIDVEGFEWNVLQGAENFIKKFKPKILLEFTPSFYNKIDKSISRNIYDFLVNLKYEIYDVDNHGEKYVKINSFEEIKNLDQTNIFCI